MNKKGLTLETLVKLLVAIPIVIIFAWLVIRITSESDTQTVNSFNTLGSELEQIIEDLETTNKAEITVPIYIHQDWAIRTAKKENSPPKCKQQPCLILHKKEDLNAIKDVIPFKDIQFIQFDPIVTPKSQIISVKIIGEKTDSKITISIGKV